MPLTVKLNPGDAAELKKLRAQVNELLAWRRTMTGGSAGGGQRARQQPTPRSDLIRVRLTQIAGAAGSNSTRCSFTYDVFGWADTAKAAKLNMPTTGPGASIPVAVEGNAGRNQLGAYTAGTYGLAYYDLDGVLKLWWTNEYASAVACA